MRMVIIIYHDLCFVLVTCIFGSIYYTVDTSYFSLYVHRTSAGVVNGADLKSAGLWPRRFESFRIRFLHLRLSVRAQYGTTHVGKQSPEG